MLIKRIVWLLIFILSLSAPVLAAEPGNGIIEGRVVNGTADGSSITDQGITLKTYQNDAEAGATTSKTDAEGHFIFDGLSAESDYSYQVELNFQEADYSGAWLSFDDDFTSGKIRQKSYQRLRAEKKAQLVTLMQRPMENSGKG